FYVHRPWPVFVGHRRAQPARLHAPRKKSSLHRAITSVPDRHASPDASTLRDRPEFAALSGRPRRRNARGSTNSPASDRSIASTLREREWLLATYGAGLHNEGNGRPSGEVPGKQPVLIVRAQSHRDCSRR